MKLHILSDTHIASLERSSREFEEDILKRFAGDPEGVFVLCGDFGKFNIPSHRKILKEICSRYEQVLFVAGNHEYYHLTKEKTENLIYDFQASVNNFKFLNNESYNYKGKKFIGGTMWFSNYTAEQALNFYGFSCIRGLGDWVRQSNTYFKKILNNECDSDTIVLSHYASSVNSISAKFKENKYNCFFYDPCDNEIVHKWKPKLWIHGHIHEVFDYVLGSTRIICNPLGYPGRLKTQVKIVDI